MNKDNFQTFDDFWSGIINPPKVNNQSAEEIIEEVDNILNQFKGVAS